MKIRIDESGVITLTVENTFEEFAIKKWQRDNFVPHWAGHDDIIVRQEKGRYREHCLRIEEVRP